MIISSDGKIQPIVTYAEIGNDWQHYGFHVFITAIIPNDINVTEMFQHEDWIFNSIHLKLASGSTYVKYEDEENIGNYNFRRRGVTYIDMFFTVSNLELHRVHNPLAKAFNDKNGRDTIAKTIVSPVAEIAKRAYSDISPIVMPADARGELLIEDEKDDSIVNPYTLLDPLSEF